MRIPVGIMQFQWNNHANCIINRANSAQNRANTTFAVQDALAQYNHPPTQKNPTTKIARFHFKNDYFTSTQPFLIANTTA